MYVEYNMIFIKLSIKKIRFCYAKFNTIHPFAKLILEKNNIHSIVEAFFSVPLKSYCTFIFLYSTPKDF